MEAAPVGRRTEHAEEVVAKQQQDDTLSDVEREAVKQRAAELRAQSSRKGAGKKEKDRQDVLDVIEGLPEPDKGLAQMVHEVVSEVAPDLDPKTWYGFPSYARDGKVLVFFRHPRGARAHRRARAAGHQLRRMRGSGMRAASQDVAT